VQVIIAALRQLEAALSSCGITSSSFNSQALQGILLKALVPLTHPNTMAAAAAAANDLPHSCSTSSNSSGRILTAATKDRQQQQQLLRLLQLPQRYDPRQLPQGSQVLPMPPHAAAAAVAPVHQRVEKDGVRLQASGEALFAGDVAARMGGHVLYLASECV
jgi:hypothetical protein